MNSNPAAGNKFLCSALMTLDRIAHWSSEVEYGQISYKQWASQQWCCPDKNLWIAYEPMTQWELTFFSRTMPRGEDLDLERFDKLCKAHSSDYFKQIWAGDKLVLDFLHKSKIPLWWRGSRVISLKGDLNDPLYQKFLLTKVLPWDPITGHGTILLDKPMPEQKYKNTHLNYQNKWQHGPFETSRDWLSWVFSNDPKFNFFTNDPDATLQDLLDFSKVESLISKIANQLSSRFDLDNLKFVHDVWMTNNRRFIQDEI